MITVHVSPEVGEQLLPKLRKACPFWPEAFSDTVEPDGKAAEHKLVVLLLQLIPAGPLVTKPSAIGVMFTVRMFVAVPCGHPRLAGPSTVIETKLLTMSLGLSCMLAKICATPQLVFGETVPGLVNCATCGLSDCHVTW